MSTEGRTAGAGPHAVGGVSAWTLYLSVLGVLLLVLGALYWGDVRDAVRVWWISPTFSHCFLIIPVSAYLIWGKRHVLAQLTPAAFPKALLLALPVMAASFVGSLASINEVEQLAFVAYVQILTLAVLGPQVYRKILFPSLFLFFLVPMGEYLIPPLQRFTTWFIDTGLNLLGILHYTEGTLIQLANGSFRVVEACAGLRFLIATIAVGVLFAHFTYRKRTKIALFLAACVIVPIISNGFRALGIVLLAHFSDNKIAVGADHLVYGWGFSVAILALLMLVGSRFADDMPADEPARTDSAAPPPTPHALTLTILAALVAISLVPAFHFWRAQTQKEIDVTAFSAPPQIKGWSLGKVSEDWHPLYAVPDAGLSFAMRGDAFSPPVDVFVNYYGVSGERRNLISSTNKLWDEEEWHRVAEGEAVATLGTENVRFEELQIASGGLMRLVWWTYSSGGSFTTSGMHVKLDRVKTALLGGRGAALVAVSTPIDVDVESARARLRRALADLGGLKGRLEHPVMEP